MWWSTLWLVGCIFGGGDPPSGVSFEGSVSRITEGETVDLTLMVDDPQGTDDVVGVTIEDTDIGAVVAEVTGPPSEDGTYVVTVSWDDFVALEPLDFEEDDLRPLDAVFEDKKGNLSGPISFKPPSRVPGVQRHGGGRQVLQPLPHRPVGEQQLRRGV